MIQYYILGVGRAGIREINTDRKGQAINMQYDDGSVGGLEEGEVWTAENNAIPRQGIWVARRKA